MQLQRHRILVCLFAALALLPPVSVAAEPRESAELDAVIKQYRAEGPETTLPRFERLQALYERNGDRFNEARAEHFIGECHWRLGNYSRSREYLENSLEDSRELRHRLAEGKTLNVLGLLEWDQGNYDQAIAWFQQASAIGSELGDARLAGSTMNNLSLVYDELGDYPTSLKQYQQALELYKGANFPRGESDTLGNIGGTYLLLGRYQEALSYYQRALAISESLNSKPSMSLDHGNLAFCYLGLGRLYQALNHIDQALALAVETGMRKEEALWLRGKGNILIRNGRYDLGLANHRAALAIYEEIEARGLLLDGLHDMGRLHLMLGDLQTAEHYFQRGTELASELGLEQAITANLLAQGDLQFRREHPKQAEALYQQALTRAVRAGELNFQSESLLRLSLAHRELQQAAQAEQEAREALAIAGNTGASSIQAEAWFALGELARLQSDVNTALMAYGKAEETVTTGSNPDLMWQVHYGRARALEDNSLREEAVSELKAAVQIIESVRERLREERFRAGYIQDKYQVYVDLVRLQLELGQTQKAFDTAERLRARSFLEQLESGRPARRGRQQDLQEYTLRERIRQLQIALDEEYGMPPPQRRQLAVDSFSGELHAAESEYQAYLDDRNAQSAIWNISSLPTSQDVQARLKPGEALIEYVVDHDQVMIFVLKPGSLTAVSSSLDQVNLQAKVNLVRELIQQPSNELWRTPAASLSQSLVQPLQDRHLLEGVENLYLVPHGMLNFLPFAVLPLAGPVNDRTLMEQFTISYLPAAASLVHSPTTRRVNPSLLAVAPESARLQYSLAEAQSIAKLYKPHSSLLAGRDATESAFKEKAGSFGILHLSTHGFFNAKNPLFSGLELEADERNDGLLEVHEILDLDLQAGLVTLSACETGLGSGYFARLPAGDEFISLTRAFLLAGSQSVLATLWEVDDRSTVELMEGFYTRLEGEEGAGGRAAALVQVQRELRNSMKYKHPFYWAPFVLVGQQDQAAGSRS
jgi:CHAT domain-containing protein/tetratricopeptide (TPR) repeat protein